MNRIHEEKGDGRPRHVIMEDGSAGQVQLILIGFQGGVQVFS